MKKYNFPKQKYFMAFILSLFTLAGCYTNDLEPIPGFKEDNTYVISMKMPGNFAQTRAMSLSNESEIDNKQVYFLVFKDDNGTEKFAYSAQVKKSTIHPSTNAIEYEIGLLANAAGNTDKSRIVIIANHKLTALPTVGTPKESFLSKLEFNSKVAWDVSTPRLFPMWGELANTVEVNKTITGSLGNVNMLRAVARIDVGLDYTNPTTPADENVNGLTNFKLHSVHVFRTNESGRVVPDKNNFNATTTTTGKVHTATIPTPVQTKAFTDYLSYETDAAGNSLVVGGEKMIREIYISEIKGAATEEDRHFLVIGGYYAGDTNPSYYRVNFEDVTTDALGNIHVQKHEDILRNHNYKVNIKQVVGRGHGTVTDAANFGPANIISATVTTWQDETKHRAVSGRFYFGISEETIIATDTANATAIITYDSNLTNLAASDFNVVWDNPGQLTFKVDINPTDKSIVFTTLNENITTNAIEEKATLKVKGMFDIPITVVQNQYIALYDMLCSSVKAIDMYTFVDTSRLSISLYTPDGKPLKKAMEVHLKTNEVDGIYFETGSAPGTHGPVEFPMGASEITISLWAYGSPTDNKKKELIISDINTGNRKICKVYIRTNPGPKARLVVWKNLDADATWTVSSLLNLRSLPCAVIHNNFNFGTEPDATVFMRGIEAISKGDDFMSTLGSEVGDITIVDMDALIDFKASPASQRMQLTQAEAQQIYDYLKNRNGIYISFLGSEFNKPLLELLLPNAIIHQATDKTNSKTNAERFSVVTSSIDNTITNGPFGDMRGKHWEYAAWTNTLNVTIALNQSWQTLQLEFEPLAGLYAPNGGITSYSSAPIIKRPEDPAGTEYSTMYTINGVNCLIVEYPLAAAYGGSVLHKISSGRHLYHFADHTWQYKVKHPGSYLEDLSRQKDNSGRFLIPTSTKIDSSYGPPVPTYNTLIFCNILAWAIELSNAAKAAASN